jgi:beta-1,4-N-acetylglucosaminyltransferase
VTHDARQNGDDVQPGAQNGPPAPARTRPTDRIGLVGSNGGHLAHLLALRPFWAEHDRFWVTFDAEDATSRLAGERTYWCHHPTNRNLPNLVRNTFLALRVLRRERPTLIVSSGAAVAVPFFWIGRLLGIRSVFIEVIDRIDGPTLTGRLVRPVAARILVQWQDQLRAYPGAVDVGPIL